MRLNKIIYILIAIISSCRPNYCLENQANVDKYKNEIKYLEYVQESKTEYLVDDYRNALYYLSNTSKIITQADISSTFGYRSNKIFENDIKAWKNWIKKNSCTMTDAYVDSVMKPVR